MVCRLISCTFVIWYESMCLYIHTLSLASVLFVLLDHHYTLLTHIFLVGLNHRFRVRLTMECRRQTETAMFCVFVAIETAWRRDGLFPASYTKPVFMFRSPTASVVECMRDFMRFVPLEPHWWVNQNRSSFNAAQWTANDSWQSIDVTMRYELKLNLVAYTACNVSSTSSDAFHCQLQLFNCRLNASQFTCMHV